MMQSIKIYQDLDLFLSYFFTW